jgi:hypothetical protein
LRCVEASLQGNFCEEVITLLDEWAPWVIIRSHLMDIPHADRFLLLEKGRMIAVWVKFCLEVGRLFRRRRTAAAATGHEGSQV